MAVVFVVLNRDVITQFLVIIIGCAFATNMVGLTARQLLSDRSGRDVIDT